VKNVASTDVSTN